MNSLLFFYSQSDFSYWNSQFKLFCLVISIQNFFVFTFVIHFTIIWPVVRTIQKKERKKKLLMAITSWQNLNLHSYHSPFTHFFFSFRFRFQVDILLIITHLKIQFYGVFFFLLLLFFIGIYSFAIFSPEI